MPNTTVFRLLQTNTKSNLQSDKVLVGNSFNTVVLGINNNSNKLSKRVWRVLLDSGSDGDLLFVQKGLKENVPFKERFRPQSGERQMELSERRKLAIWI